VGKPCISPTFFETAHILGIRNCAKARFSAGAVRVSYPLQAAT
jgi:hypothetical protein